MGVYVHEVTVASLSRSQLRPNLACGFPKICGNYLGGLLHLRPFRRDAVQADHTVTSVATGKRASQLAASIRFKPHPGASWAATGGAGEREVPPWWRRLLMRPPRLAVTAVATSGWWRGPWSPSWPSSGAVVPEAWDVEDALLQAEHLPQDLRSVSFRCHL